MSICNKQHLNTRFEAQFIKKLCNTEVKLQKRVAYKKAFTLIEKKGWLEIIITLFQDRLLRGFFLVKIFNCKSQLRNSITQKTSIRNFKMTLKHLGTHNTWSLVRHLSTSIWVLEQLRPSDTQQIGGLGTWQRRIQNPVEHLRLIFFAAINYFCKKPPSQMFGWALNTPLLQTLEGI